MRRKRNDKFLSNIFLAGIEIIGSYQFDRKKLKELELALISIKNKTRRKKKFMSMILFVLI